jgi:hypothetical protein
MSATLIEQLNKHGDLSPDEIVKQLNGGGWIKCSRVPLKYLEQNTDVAHVIVHWNEQRGWMRIQETWFFSSCCGDDLPALSHHLADGYWMKKQSEYVRGEFPECPD